MELSFCTVASNLILFFIFVFSRALQTINIREENEKLNIWVAYFNLENEYGNPPEVIKQRAALFIHLFF